MKFLFFLFFLPAVMAGCTTAGQERLASAAASTAGAVDAINLATRNVATMQEKAGKDPGKIKEKVGDTADHLQGALGYMAEALEEGAKGLASKRK